MDYTPYQASESVANLNETIAGGKKLAKILLQLGYQNPELWVNKTVIGQAQGSLSLDDFLAANPDFPQETELYLEFWVRGMQDTVSPDNQANVALTLDKLRNDPGRTPAGRIQAVVDSIDQALDANERKESHERVLQFINSNPNINAEIEAALA